MTLPRVLIAGIGNPAVHAIEEYIANNGFDIVRAPDDSYVLTSAPDFDLVVINAVASRIPAMQLLRFVRSNTTLPILVLTDATSSERTAALEYGADDSIGVPCDLRELIARVRALLRRATGKAGSRDALEINSVRIEPAARAVWASGEPVELTSAEYAVLETLIFDAGNVVSRERLTLASNSRTARSLDVHVARLRKKIGRPSPIRTVRGRGYLFCPDA